MACLHSEKAFQYQSSCNFSCEEGYALVGPEVVQCTASGMWTAPVPVCKGEFQAVGDVHCPLYLVLAGSTDETELVEKLA